MLFSFVCSEIQLVLVDFMMRRGSQPWRDQRIRTCVRNGVDGRELATARWGMPSSQHALMEATKKRAAKLEAKGKPVDFKELLRMEPDGGTTNIRNVKSKHWTRWLDPGHRCVVPFNLCVPRT
jgi:putative SOS response-associated peptidase YedK